MRLTQRIMETNCCDLRSSGKLDDMFPTLDPDLLRAFVFIAEDGSFTRAAQRVGRTQSAVSMQVQRLEAQLGQRLLSRNKGGTVQLTPHGQFLLARARDVLALNDEIWTSFRTPAMHGTVRLGTPDDYALRYLPQILMRFAESHPSVQVEVMCLPSSQLVERLRAGELDLTLCSEGHEPAGWPVVTLWRGPLTWITSVRHAPHRQDPLPVALAADHCSWRVAAVRALEGAGRRYRVAYQSGDAGWNARAGFGRVGGDGVHRVLVAGGSAGACGRMRVCRRCPISAF